MAAKSSRTKSRRQYQAGTGVGTYIPPQLCKLIDTPPDGARWVHETKLDGYRMQMHVRGGEPKFYSRKGLDWTHRFPEIAAACAGLETCILDGEVCAIDKSGLPTFSGLTDALSAKSTGGLVYFVFDLLWGNGEDLRSYPLETRKKVLAKLLKGPKGAARRRVHYVEHHAGDGAALLEAACRMKLEGIVSKVRDAPYKPDDRSGIWTKAKCRPAQEVVVGGWKSTGSKFSSLLLGAHVGGQFVFVGHAGTGFNTRNLPGLQAALAERAADVRPFANKGEPKPSRDHHWVKPTLVVEVEFTSWTSDKLMRQVSFKGIREDKNAKNVVIEHAD